MPKYYDSITPELAEWALNQPVFWVATAPLVGKHINISPKGLPSASFAILSPHKVAYIDYTGSAAETISHLYENGRITVLFNSFSTSPRVLRLYCTGEVIEATGPSKEGFSNVIKQMGLDIAKVHPSARAVLVMDVWKVQTSCGFGVPIAKAGTANEGENAAIEFEDRKTLGEWGMKTVQKGEIQNYQVKWNKDSHDGLMGLKSARRAAGERWLWWGDFKTRGKRLLGMADALGLGFVLGVIFSVGLRLLGSLVAYVLK